MSPGKNLQHAFSIFAIASTLCVASAVATSPAVAQERTHKVLYIMSYHSPWRWTDGQLEGFKEGMRGLKAEYKVFQMDTKRNSSPEAKERMGKEAMALIAAWKPDLVYTSDDDAQEYVARYYVNKHIPFVFSGVNKDPKAYGFDGSRNVSGVLEEEHFVESVKLLQAIVPGARRIAAVFDDASMWEPVRARMKARIGQVPGVEIVAWDTILTFDGYKRKIKEYPGKADAIALIGIFNFKDERGKNVPYQDVLKWTAENSRLPDFGFWIDRVHYGTLLAVTVSEREQGLAAGRIARSVLAEGKSPSDFPMQPTVKGLPVISLARAQKLGIKVKSGLLLSAEVIQKYEWNK